MNKFEVCSLVLLWDLVDVASKGRKIDLVPYCVGPVVFLLEIVAKVSTIDVKTEICVKVAVVPGAIDGDGDSC